MPAFRALRPVLLLLLALLQGACSPFGPTETRVRVRFQERATITRAMLGATMWDGRFEWVLLGSDFEADGGAWTSRDIRVGSGDAVQLLIGVYEPTTRAAITEVSIDLPAASPHRWRIDVEPGATRAQLRCPTCSVRSAPLPEAWRGDGADSLFVTWRDATER